MANPKKISEDMEKKLISLGYEMSVINEMENDPSYTTENINCLIKYSLEEEEIRRWEEAP